VTRGAATRRRREPAPGGGQAGGGQPTREVILDTAERLFAARGVDGVAVRDLARAMGITASSLYNHFLSKQALYDAVIERGVGPIVELVGESWRPGTLRSEDVHAALDRLTTHLARHPNLARLLQRALFEEAGPLQIIVERWVRLLYREGISVIRRSARESGWAPAEVPHLGIALFGMIFAYFINPAAHGRLVGWTEDPLSPRALAVQRRFLEQAVFRLLGPRPRGTFRRRRHSTAPAHGRRRPSHD
jgi:AcrR family transcriptional regulator